MSRVNEVPKEIQAAALIAAAEIASVDLMTSPPGKLPPSMAQQIADLAVEILNRYMKRSREELG
jgi:hypothetical protein